MAEGQVTDTDPISQEPTSVAAKTPAADPYAQFQGEYEKRGKEIETAAARIESLGADRTKLANTPLPRVAPPAVQNAPAPPQAQYQNVFKEAMNPLIFLTAMGAGMMSKNHGMGAMKAATGFMEGFQEGDQKRINLEKQNWENNMRALTENNRNAALRYNAALNNNQISQVERQAQIGAIAAQIQDTMVTDAMRGGRYDLAQKLIEKRLEAASKLEEQRLNRQEKKEEFGIRQEEVHRANLMKEEGLKQQRLDRQDHYREMAELARDKAQRMSPTEARASRSIDSAVDDIDSALEIMARDPGVATHWGNLARQGTNFAKYWLGGEYNADAATFEQKISSLRSQAPGILGASRTLKGNYADISKSIGALQTMSTPQGVFEALSGMREKLTGMQEDMAAGRAGPPALAPAPGSPKANGAAVAPKPVSGTIPDEVIPYLKENKISRFDIDGKKRRFTISNGVPVELGPE